MRTINNHRTAGLLSASALAISLVAIAQPALAAGEIINTRHNLSSGVTSTASSRTHVTDGTDQICVFCHTPHGSSSDILAPLWNKSINTAATAYLMYNSANSGTFEGANTGGPGRVSMACLTCHDGTQAMDKIIKAPGTGGYTANGGGLTGLSYTWVAGNSVALTSDGKLSNTATRQLVLGTDLVNDHPIGMNYCAATTGASISTTAACADKDFYTGTTDGKKWWIDTGTAGTYQKTDFPLYGINGDNLRVECATCHNPHVGTALNTFLRINNTGSAVCLTCHNK